MSTLFREFVPKAGATQTKERLQNFREDETGGRDRERYDDERVDPGG